ncbi:GNAT family N-acetyltransferase [Phenylobacterium sp.]|uniref:GNAT family N-acetyltransferase n=1 Tax=Phenylobacterium sp. TaxID=1871053 RepID=UPI002FD965FB
MTGVRLAQAAELSLLPAIEVSAAGLFAESGMQIFPGDPSDQPADFTPVEAWRDLLERGWIWVTEDQAGAVAAFLAAEPIEQRLHILELDVHRDAQRQGLGRRLMATALAEARAMGLRGASLTTFRDVAWNAPFYESLGFRIVDAPSGALAAFLAREAERGLEPGRRCAMVVAF